MSYEDTLRQLSDGTRELAERLVDALEAGQIDADEFSSLLVQLVATANAQGAADATLALRAYIEAATEAPAYVRTVRAPDTAPRLADAVTTILANQQADTRMQVQRLAVNEPLDAAATAYSAAMDKTPTVTGWVRELEGDACQLCEWWWRDGRVWPADHPMPRHPGCTCHPRPVVTTEPIKPVSTKRKRTK